ncbi:MAG TPA: biotin/lipoyl-binding protein [Candidatus Mcinerneyibacteriales bacterium]|nr:biotin/lipoyl-binding protein [Candidatus Mcinerneyibacteriales bacterium]HPQ89289.1 biotin/lipoyl-binding protein [Candidatus Mcinerneyibacteriales bacterium]
MKEITLEINGKEYKVKVQEFGAEKAKLSVNGTEYTVGLKDLGEPKALDIRPAAPPLKRQPAPAAKEGEPLRKPREVVGSGHVTAPLPGLILEILVKEGDTVKAGQDVLIMEAMKMENEVQSPQEGTVKEIKVRRGDSVYEGDILIVLE